jgi:hypothetical protein
VRSEFFKFISPRDLEENIKAQSKEGDGTLRSHTSPKAVVSYGSVSGSRPFVASTYANELRSFSLNVQAHTAKMLDTLLRQVHDTYGAAAADEFEDRTIEINDSIAAAGLRQTALKTTPSEYTSQFAQNDFMKAFQQSISFRERPLPSESLPMSRSFDVRNNSSALGHTPQRRSYASVAGSDDVAPTTGGDHNPDEGVTGTLTTLPRLVKSTPTSPSGEKGDSRPGDESGDGAAAADKGSEQADNKLSDDDVNEAVVREEQ